ncbi:MAG: glycosyltransferase family 4 protein [Candidatus Eremiobacter antarcticus]|nr:glycosyltransferase [Candidatus Eremiobacteraeota bacterium]MBC5807409.1 glycosyltransferase [Candidatus Eremiobacteraeota bacterium]PZR63156.1 MAG: glycosyltransferase family 4 protein [Candidatus Eremiobacter sp. RRmetagenome_bin22]
MKIALFTEVYRPIINGVVTSVDSLAEQLRVLGHEVFMFAPHIPNGVESAGRVFRMPSLPLPTRTEYRLTLPLVARRNKIRFLSQCDIIHSHSLFITGWMASYYARRRFRIPFVYTYHTLLDSYAHYSPLGQHLTSQLTRELTRTYANAADAVIVPTKMVAAELRKQGVTAPLSVVPTGIDIDAFRPDPEARRSVRRLLEIAPDAPVLLLVSRLAQEKNVPLALEALSRLHERLPKAVLVLVGSGPLMGVLKEQVKASGLEDAVRFAGVVPHQMIASFYAAADVFVFPSLTETQGLVLAEAFAAGLPAVALDSPQTREVFGTHLAGEIVADAGAMADAAFELITVPVRRALAKAHAKTAAAAFDSRVTAAKMLAIYEAVVSNAARSSGQSESAEPLHESRMETVI